MANWHALTGTTDGNSYTIVYHIAVPNTNNRVGINYRTALINSGLGGTTQLPDGSGTDGTISAAEKTQIMAGEIYERVEGFPTNPGRTAMQLQTAVDARHATLTTLLQAELSNQLAYFGYTH